MSANPVRGEVSISIGGVDLTLRPSFAALVAAEAELGPLFALVERAAAGNLKLDELGGLLWHCLVQPPEGISRTLFCEALVVAGLAAATPALRTLLTQILHGK